MATQKIGVVIDKEDKPVNPYCLGIDLTWLGEHAKRLVDPEQPLKNEDKLQHLLHVVHHAMQALASIMPDELPANIKIPDGFFMTKKT